MSDKEPLRITLEDLGEEEKPAVPEGSQRNLREGVGQAGQKVAGVVKDSTNRVAQKIADTTTEAANRSAEAIHDKVSETIQAQSKATADAVEARLREIDWKGEAQKGAEGGLRWLSSRLEELAGRLRAEEKDGKQ